MHSTVSRINTTATVVNHKILLTEKHGTMELRLFLIWSVNIFTVLNSSKCSCAWSITTFGNLLRRWHATMQAISGHTILRVMIGQKWIRTSVEEAPPCMSCSYEIPGIYFRTAYRVTQIWWCRTHLCDICLGCILYTIASLSSKLW